MYQTLFPRRIGFPDLLYRLAQTIRRHGASAQPEAPRTASAEDAQARLLRVFRAHGDAVLRAAYAYLHNRSDAEDVVQDTFLQFYRTAPALQSPEHERAWLLRVAINRSKNTLKSSWFRRTQALEDDTPCPDDDLSFLWDAVRALPPKYREPIHLFYQEGYSTAEIASLLGQKESTVRSLLHRGRGLLKSLLKEAYDFDESL